MPGCISKKHFALRQTLEKRKATLPVLPENEKLIDTADAK
jgi:hypothetical protein